MKMIINVPSELLSMLQSKKFISHRTIEIMKVLILNGTPLPEEAQDDTYNEKWLNDNYPHLYSEYKKELEEHMIE